MENFDSSSCSSSIVAQGRLSILAAHLAAATNESSSSLEPCCVLAQDLVTRPGNLKGSLTIVDERTGNKYQIQVSPQGTVNASDFKKVRTYVGKIKLKRSELVIHLQIRTGKYDKGLKLYDPGYLNTAPVRSAICYIDGDEGILRYRGYPIEELAESSTFWKFLTS